MKNFFYTLLLSLFGFSLTAQCDMPFGEFESWYDFVEEPGQPLPQDILFLPDSTFVAFRIFELFNIDVDSLVLNTPEENLSTQLFGLSMSPESRSGDYALKFGGDTSIGFSDLVSRIGCDDVEPANFVSFYYKHYGEETDSLYVQIVLSDKQLVVDVELDDPEVGVSFDSLLIVDSEESDQWKWAQIPVNINDADITLDSMSFFMLRIGEASADNYWLVDDIQWNIETALIDEDQNVIFQVGQSLDSRTLFVQLDQEKYAFKSYQILDINGRKVEPTKTEFQNRIDIQHLEKGSYIMQVETEGGVIAKPFIRY